MRATRLFITSLALAATTLTLCAADAKEKYEQSCAKCHGTDGKADTKMGKKLAVKDFTDAAYQGSFTDAQAIAAIKEGVKDGDKVRMKAFEDLSDDEIKSLVAYVRAFKK